MAGAPESYHLRKISEAYFEGVMSARLAREWIEFQITAGTAALSWWDGGVTGMARFFSPIDSLESNFFYIDGHNPLETLGIL